MRQRTAVAGKCSVRSALPHQSRGARPYSLPLRPKARSSGGVRPSRLLGALRSSRVRASCVPHVAQERRSLHPTSGSQQDRWMKGAQARAFLVPRARAECLADDRRLARVRTPLGRNSLGGLSQNSRRAISSEGTDLRRCLSGGRFRDAWRPRLASHQGRSFVAARKWSRPHQIGTRAFTT
jgi:hypothetical protein